MNPVVSYICSNLESNGKAIDRIIGTLRCQNRVNKDLILGLYVVMGVATYSLYRTNLCEKKIAALESKIEELETKGD